MQSRNTAGGNADSAPSAAAKGSDLRTRLLSSLVLGPAVLAAVIVGEWLFRAGIYIFALLAVVEWIRLVSPGQAVISGLLAGAGVAVVLASEVVWGVGPALLVMVAATLILLVANWTTGIRHRWLVAFTVPYLALASLSLIWIRERPEDGLGLVVYLLLVIWATDIGAYAAGRRIGGPKLAPRISPKKTWAGLIGGAVSAAVVGVLVAYAFGSEAPWLVGVFGAALAVVGQAGDLFESAIKRRFNVKDSGRLIPGHGGLLDRVDGLIAAAPVFAVFYAVWETSASWW